MSDITNIEKIKTTYKDFHNLVKENPDEQFYVEKPDGSLAQINATVEKPVDQMYEIEFETGYKIECADTHSFMDKNGDPLFVKDIVKNKRVMTNKGTLTVKSIKKTKNKTAFDINIDSPHWYINDENGIIHHNTLLGLVGMKAFLDKHEDGLGILYDSEFGITPEYLKTIGIPTERVLHIPIKNIEELKFDMTQRLNELTKKDKVYILIDSLGNLASLKEATDAEDGKSVQDMSRAKQIKSLFRIITPEFTLKNIPCIIVNHIYESQGCLDGNTLIKTTEGIKEIKEINVDDYVYGTSGIQKVTNVLTPIDISIENKEFYELEFDDGSKVKCTGNHKFLLDNDTWVEAKDLKLDTRFK